MFNHIVFKVTEISDDSTEVVIEYLYRSPIIIGPIDICERYPYLCDIIYECVLCDIFTYRVFDDTIIVEFDEYFEKAIIPVDKICLYVIDCPGCDPTGLCVEYDFILEGMIDQLDLLVYNSKGEIITRGKSFDEYMEVQFKTSRAEKYFLVLKPSRDMKLGIEKTLTIKQQLR